jgi:hypothetical protein
MILLCFWDGRFWLPSVGGATRLRNLAQQPWAALVVHEGEGTDHIVVLAEGPAVVHTDVAEVFAGGLADTWRERIGEVPEWAAALIEVRPTKVLSYGPRGVSGSEQAGRDWVGRMRPGRLPGRTAG